MRRAFLSPSALRRTSNPQALATMAALALAAATAGCGTKGLDGIGPAGSGAGTGAVPGGTGGVSALCAPSDSNGASAPGFMLPSSPVLNGIVTAADPPPAISGGTLLVLRDGNTAVAGDADRDRVYVVDLAGRAVRTSIALSPHDQPGRLVQDGAGLVHVVLRGAGMLATVDVTAGKVTQRRAVCSTPRGLAYDAATDRLHVACGGGELVTFTPTGTAPERTLKYQQDLRDVVVDGARLMVTRFRSAEVMVVDSAGTMMDVIHLPSFTNPRVQNATPFQPSVAWRATGSPEGGMVMVHQRGMHGQVGSTAGGYGGKDSCGSIVHSSVTRVKQGERPVAGPAIPGFVLPVDVAVSPDGRRVALVAAGNGRTVSETPEAQKMFVTNIDDVTQEWQDGCGFDGKHGPGFCSVTPPPGSDVPMMPTVPLNPDGSCPEKFTPCNGVCISIVDKCDPAAPAGSSAAPAGSSTGPTMPGVAGVAGGAGGATAGPQVPADVVTSCPGQLPPSVEPVSVAFAGNTAVVVQTREPAQLFIVDGSVVSSIMLSQESRFDTGHTVFHANSGGGIACASCHPEGHEDGRVWQFACEGSRRTQDLGGGISGTEPFHWGGDLNNFPKLVDTVFVGRMSGPSLNREQTAAALSWINTIPARTPLRPATDPAVARGKALFDSPTVACASCHAGAALTNNQNADVHTSAAFQVPSLRGVSGRAPFMHDGCAPTLLSRFTDTVCGGGDVHGKTSQLTPLQLGDLVAYLESL